jgi:hypothetical protein
MTVGNIPVDVPADLDGDGNYEIVRAMPNGATEVIKNGATIWVTQGSIDGWNRSPSDRFLSHGVDLDQDGKDEVVLLGATGWTGVLKWDGAQLHCPWATASPVAGSGISWNRRVSDGLGITQWDGAPAVFISHVEDNWYGVLAWQGTGLHLVSLWNAVPPLTRKFTYLFNRVEVTGEVVELVAANPNAPTISLAVDRGFHAITDFVNGAAPPNQDHIFHCETYPEAIATPGANGENQINFLSPFQPWPAGDAFSAVNGGTPLNASWAAGGAVLVKARTANSPGDRIRVRGRLIVENGHPNPEPPGWPPGVGRVFIELHPFDWRNLVFDPLGSGPALVSSHTMLLISPLYEGVQLATQPDPEWHDQLNWRLYMPAYHNATSLTAQFDAPQFGSGPVAYTETVMVNRTGQPIDQLRTIEATATGIVVRANVQAPITGQVGAYPMAEFGQLTQTAQPSGVLQVRYDVYWENEPGGLLHTAHHTDGAWDQSVRADANVNSNISGRPLTVTAASDTPGQTQFVIGMADHSLVHALHDTTGFKPAANITDMIGGQTAQILATAAASAEPGLTQFMSAVADGRLLHTTRRAADQGWYPVGDVKGQIGDIGHVAAAAGCSDPAKPGVAQWILATAEGGLWHAVRFADGTWSLGDVKGQIGDIGTVIAVAAVGTITDFGSTQFVLVTADDRMWHTTHNSDSGNWATAGDLKGQIGDFGTVIAVTAVSSQPGYSQFMFTTSDGRLYHTSRRPDGTWYPLGNVLGQVAVESTFQPRGLAAASAAPDIAEYFIIAFDFAGPT